MADEITNNLIRFALHNSNFPDVVIKPDSIENENANNARYLMKSKEPSEKKAGKILIKFMADDGNEVAEVIKLIEAEQSETNTNNAKKDRTEKPTKETLETFRVNWSEKYYLDHGEENRVHGWKKEAQKEFKLSAKTLNAILNEILTEL